VFRSSPWYAATVLGCCYFVIAGLTVAFTRFDGGVAFIWAASGLLLARLAQLHVRQWVLPLVTCAVASVAMSALFGVGIADAPAVTMCSLSESIMAALMLRRFVGASVRTDTVRSVGWFLLAAGVIAPAISGVGGAMVISKVSHASFITTWLNWFAAHGLGASLVAPIAHAIMSGDALRWKRRVGARHAASTFATLLLVGAVTALAFGQNRMPLLFLPLLPMVFATVRGGRPGAIGSTIVLAVTAGAFSANGAGPIHLFQASAGARAIFLQAYIAYAALLVMPVAAILTQRRALLHRLRDSEARYRTIADSLGDAVVDVAIDGTIRYASPAITMLTGVSPEALIGADARVLVGDEHAALVWSAHEAAIASPGQSVTVQYRGPAPASERWFEVSVRAAVSPEGEALGVVGSIRDITLRKNEEQQLQHEAQTDALTGLPNRRAFHAMLADAVDRPADEGARDCLAIFDLDRFKSINDTFGHAAGDAVLVAVAKAAQASLRATDRIGRIGGEEFAMLLRGSRPGETTAAAERLQDAIRALRIPVGDGATVTVTVSMGLCETTPFADIDQLMSRADHALYIAKRSGRDCLKIAA
jgi:diguanylate cyclase (GGDEF)-like protein/PAS domain S-box-containing protein